MAQREQTNDLHDRSLPELVKSLAHQTTTLVRQEVELAKAELSEKLELARAEMSTSLEHARAEFSESSDRVRAELAANSKQAGIGVGFLAAAGGIGLLALGALTAFFILAIDGALPNWAAALIITVAYVVIATVLYSMGRRQVRRALPLVSPNTMRAIKKGAGQIVSESRERAQEVWPPAPEQAVETVKEDIEWAKSPTRSVKR